MLNTDTLIFLIQVVFETFAGFVECLGEHSALGSERSLRERCEWAQIISQWIFQLFVGKPFYRLSPALSSLERSRKICLSTRNCLKHNVAHHWVTLHFWPDLEFQRYIRNNFRGILPFCNFDFCDLYISTSNRIHSYPRKV